MKQNNAAGRRKFLKGIAAAGSATALTSVFASDLIARDPALNALATNPQSGSHGYHETEHIRQYYRTLRS